MALSVTLAAVGGVVAEDCQEDPNRPAPAGLSLTADATTPVYAYAYTIAKGNTYYSAP